MEYTPDGRAIVNTVGSRRFKIVSKSARDGYNTAAVEFLEVGTKRLQNGIKCKLACAMSHSIPYIAFQRHIHLLYVITHAFL